jgi:hypothetical protein
MPLARPGSSRPSAAHGGQRRDDLRREGRGRDVRARPPRTSRRTHRADWALRCETTNGRRELETLELSRVAAALALAVTKPEYETLCRAGPGRAGRLGSAVARGARRGAPQPRVLKRGDGKVRAQQDRRAALMLFGNDLAGEVIGDLPDPQVIRLPGRDSGGRVRQLAKLARLGEVGESSPQQQRVDDEMYVVAADALAPCRSAVFSVMPTISPVGVSPRSIPLTASSTSASPTRTKTSGSTSRG